MKISLKAEKKSIEFMGVERNELEGMVEYFKSRSVAVEMEEDPNQKLKADLGNDDDDDEDDDDFNAEEGDSDDDGSSSEEDESFSEE